MYYKELLGATATIIGFVSYLPYFRDVFRGKTKPHAFSWLIWGILTTIGFAGQISDNAGPAAWVTGSTAVFCFLIFLLALSKGEHKIVLIDWFSLLGAGISLLLWVVTREPTLSVILISLIAIFGFIPTFRKSFMKPHQETFITFALNGLKFAIALFALEKLSLVTYLYPLSLVTMNWLLVLVLIIRKKS